MQYSGSTALHRTHKGGFTFAMFLNMADKNYDVANFITISNVWRQADASEVHEDTTGVPFIVSPFTAASSHTKSASIEPSCNGVRTHGHQEGQIL